MVLVGPYTFVRVEGGGGGGPFKEAKQGYFLMLRQKFLEPDTRKRIGNLVPFGE